MGSIATTTPLCIRGALCLPDLSLPGRLVHSLTAFLLPPLPPDVQFPSNNDGYHATSNNHHMPGIDDAQTGAGAANQFYY